MAQKFSICGTVGGNTGSIDCDVRKGLPVQMVVGGAVFTPGEYASNASFETAFLAKLILATGNSNKLFPFPVFQGNTPKTTAAKTATLGYGLELKLQRSKAGYEFDVLAGSDLEKKLMKFDGLIVPIFIFDDKNRIWGTFDSEKNFRGANWVIGVEPKDFEDGQNAKTTKITISIVDSRDFVENMEYADTTFNTSELVGLNDVTLEEVVANTSNVYKIGGHIKTASVNSFINVFETTGFAAAIASGAIWVAKTGANFTTTLAITSVAQDGTNKCWTVTFDSTAYTALGGVGLIKLYWVDPTALDTANITGVESLPLIIDVAA